eukprot:scaffold816_cov108-Skeletonema_dohrnii-CCMP3373.AAC.2
MGTSFEYIFEIWHAHDTTIDIWSTAAVRYWYSKLWWELRHITSWSSGATIKATFHRNENDPTLNDAFYSGSACRVIERRCIIGLAVQRCKCFTRSCTEYTNAAESKNISIGSPKKKPAQSKHTEIAKYNTI